MALEQAHLRKLLILMFLDLKRLQSLVRDDIREDRKREDRIREGREPPSGGDFYSYFWADAKNHVFAFSDLHEAVEERIAANYQRRNLYPILRDGFLLWWNEHRGRTNEPFQTGRHVKARFSFPGIAAVVKVGGVLSVRDRLGVEHFIYPYFAPELVLSDDAARLGLWLLSAALPTVPSNAIRILDVIRGRAFSLDPSAPTRDDEGEFRRRYLELLRLRDELARGAR